MLVSRRMENVTLITSIQEFDILLNVSLRSDESKSPRMHMKIKKGERRSLVKWHSLTR